MSKPEPDRTHSLGTPSRQPAQVINNDCHPERAQRVEGPASCFSETSSSPQEDDEPNPGPNLILLYSLIALALAAAIGFALLIVLPFYHRR